MLNCREILAPEPGQRRPIDFCVAAHVIMYARRERLPRFVLPHLRSLISFLIEYSLRTPVFRLLRQIIPTFHEQDTSAAVSQRIGQRPTARACPDDNDVVIS